MTKKEKAAMKVAQAWKAEARAATQAGAGAGAATTARVERARALAWEGVWEAKAATTARVPK